LDIYIKPKKKAALVNRHDILISDVAEIVAPSASVIKINRMKLKDVESDRKVRNYVVSVTAIIKKINKGYPDATINNVGETDSWVHCTFAK
jgi:hypothetical protein